MYKEIVGFIREKFGGAAQTGRDTGPFAGLHKAYEEGVLGDVPFLPALLQTQGPAGQEETPDGYALGEQTPPPPRLDPSVV